MILKCLKCTVELFCNASLELDGIFFTEDVPAAHAVLNGEHGVMRSGDDASFDEDAAEAGTDTGERLLRAAEEGDGVARIDGDVRYAVSLFAGAVKTEAAARFADEDEWKITATHRAKGSIDFRLVGNVADGGEDYGLIAAASSIFVLQSARCAGGEGGHLGGRAGEADDVFVCGEEGVRRGSVFCEEATEDSLHGLSLRECGDGLVLTDDGEVPRFEGIEEGSEDRLELLAGGDTSEFARVVDTLIEEPSAEHVVVDATQHGIADERLELCCGQSGLRECGCSLQSIANGVIRFSCWS